MAPLLPLAGIALLAFVFTGTAAANPPATADPPRPAAFAPTFPRPTGQNGYEDIVAAADLIRDNAALDAALAPDATLMQKRAVLASSVCRQALALARQGLARPILTSPLLATGNSDAPGEATSSQRRDMPLVARLGGLFVVEQYVLAADGRAGAAVDSFNDTLRLTDAVRGDGGLASLYAAQIDQASLEAIACHMAQWSWKDCDRLLALIQQRLRAWPDLGIAALEGDRRQRLARLDSVRTTLEAITPATLEAALHRDGGGDTSGTISALYQRWIALGAEPDRHRAAFAALRDRLQRIYQRLEAANPYQASPPEMLGTAVPSAAATADQADTAMDGADRAVTDFVDAYLVVTLPDLSRVRSHFAREDVSLRLLAVHAALRRYRWEYGHLPASLTDLPLPAALATDPCSGGSWQYRRSADAAGYTLSSVGQRTARPDPAGGWLVSSTPITLPSAPPLPWQ
jgi:hypothetical protein